MRAARWVALRSRPSGTRNVTEPAADLAVALALASAALERAFPSDAIAIGEVGLAGEIRPVTGMPRRLAVAARLGFRRAFVLPGTCGSVTRVPGLQLVEVAQLAQAVAVALRAAPESVVSEP